MNKEFAVAITASLLGTVAAIFVMRHLSIHFSKRHHGGGQQQVSHWKPEATPRALNVATGATAS